MAPYSLYLGALALAFSATLATSSSSPKSQAELICPTSNSEECYPQLFQPTEEFQYIKEGQDLPPGLHVRMNIYTGEKEARLNIPTAEDLALEASSSQEVVVVPELEEGYIEEEEKPVNPALRDSFPQKPPAYDMAGKVLPPRPDDGSGEAESFSSALLILKDLKGSLSDKSSDQDLDLALDVLFELSNDIYYGVEIAKDPEILWALFALMYNHDNDHRTALRDRIFAFKALKVAVTSGGTQNSPQSVLRRRQASGILAHSIQNNPTALAELSSQTVAWMEYLCILIEGETDPAPMKSKIKALSHLLNDPKLRQDFVNTSNQPSSIDGAISNGTQILLSAFLRKGTEWDGVRSQITELLLDNYVDEEMGAKLGLWPVEVVRGDAKYCSKAGHELEDGCWEYHLEKLRPGLVWKDDEIENLERLLGALRDGRKMRSGERHREL